MSTVKHFLEQGQATLESVSPTAQLDAEILLCHCLEKNRTWLKTWPDVTPDKEQINHYQELLVRRQQGEPIAYILGEQEFWSLNLLVSEATLIPRPETELLVEQVLALRSASEAISVLDLGTGTGAIALAVASECPQWQVFACDRSEDALAVAKQNQQRLGVSVEFAQSNWLSVYEQQCFDVIVSNPPYIEEQDPHLVKGDVRFEPVTALVSGKDGLDDIRHISQAASQHLNENGVLLFEHGFDQGQRVREILKNNNYSNVVTIHDLSGHDRVTLGYKGLQE